jgi:hypothetical protein
VVRRREKSKLKHEDEKEKEREKEAKRTGERALSISSVHPVTGFTFDVVCFVLTLVIISNHKLFHFFVLSNSSQ